ncbi:MAG: methyltransferase domain-containing protein [Planctomycetes bacterium]|nr:methyltransferase domain-containing protein [Planctomycetota bacterium]
MTEPVPDVKRIEDYENATWSRCAAGYRDGFGVLVAGALPDLLDAVDARAGARVLDVGTGTGLAAGAAQARGAEVTGVDFAPAMIDLARAAAPAIDFRIAPADALPFANDHFDAVVGNFVLHHCARPDAVLREALRVLRPGGRVGMTVWGEIAQLEAFGLFFAAVGEHVGVPELPHGPLFGVADPAALGDLLRAAGFDAVAVRELPLVWQTPTLAPYLAAFASWADTDALPADTRAAIERSVTATAERFRTSRGFELPNPALLLSARKPADAAVRT